MNIRLFVFFLAVLFSACSLKTEVTLKNENQFGQRQSDCFNEEFLEKDEIVPKYCESDLTWRKFFTENYFINIPGSLFKNEDVDGKRVTFYMPADFDFDPNNDPPPSDSDLDIAIHHSHPSCSPSAIGISQPIDLTDSNGENTIWGRTNEREISRGDFTPEYTDICGPYSGESMYAFCSEKDDKRVVICISQQTDDPALAEEIFKSFRWTE